MKASNLEWRMYGLVPYNISPIQQGIQFGHAVVEYGLEFGNTEAYKKWARQDKTFIILNGGTTNKNTIQAGMPCGTLNKYELDLIENVPEVPIATFEEPDLGDQLTAICFLVDERVWNVEKYPDFKYKEGLIGYDGLEMGYDVQFYVWKNKFSSSETGADHIVWLRNFLRGFKLA